MKHILILVTLSFLSVAAFAQTKSDYIARLKKWEQTKQPSAKKMNALYEIYWEHLMITNPEWATYRGHPGQNHRWTDMSRAAIERSKEEVRATLKAIKSVSEKSLKGQDLMNYRLFKFRTEERIAGFKFPEEYLAVDQMGGFHTSISDLFNAASKRNLKDYQDMITRLKTIDQPIQQTIALLREGMAKKIVQPKVTMGGIPAQFDQLLPEKIEDSPIYKAFAEVPKGVLTPEQTAQIQAEAKEIITQKVYPELKAFKKFLAEEYIPACRESIGLSELPNGKEWYDYAIKGYTTTDLTADQIFKLGNEEVNRIRGEMEKIREQVKFKGSQEKFNRSLSTDSKFYFTKAEDLVERFRAISKTIDPELPKFFGKLPRNTYGVEEVPAFKAQASAAAYYQGGSLEAGRAGIFYANTYDLKARPKWGMMSLTCHEAVPGHHFQISIAQEIENTPEFRRNMGFTAYIEGWGLYAETLCDDMGLYKDPYDKYGQLHMEMWRAVRLVLDTGIHSKGWTREQAMDFFRKAGPFAEQEVRAETDRYIVWPGQATAYKIGQLKFKELREKSKAALGEKFDIRRFHDEVLGSGALPLAVLETNVAEWIKAESKAKRVRGKVEQF